MREHELVIEEVRRELHDHPLLRRLLFGGDLAVLLHLLRQQWPRRLDLVVGILVTLCLGREAELGDRGGVVHFEERHRSRDVRPEPAHEQPFHRGKLQRLAIRFRDRLLRGWIDERFALHLAIVRQPKAAARAKTQQPVAGDVFQRLDAPGLLHRDRREGLHDLRIAKKIERWQSGAGWHDHTLAGRIVVSFGLRLLRGEAQCHPTKQKKVEQVSNLFRQGQLSGVFHLERGLRFKIHFGERRLKTCAAFVRAVSTSRGQRGHSARR